jgi:hypothetical protein
MTEENEVRTGDADAPTEDGDQIELAVIAQGDASYLQELADVLEAAEIEARVVAPEDCDTGCAPRLLLVTLPENLDAARSALEAHWNDDLDDDAKAAVSTVVDLDAAEATCPACMNTFPTDATRCPECGLNFG